MAIYKTATGWQIKIQRDGFRFNDFVKGLENYKDAVSIELSALADMSKGLRPSGGALKHGTSLTLMYAFDECWDKSWAVQSKGYQKKVLQYWKSLSNYFIDNRGMVRLESIDTKAIDDYIKVLRARGNKPKTINNKLNCLSSMLTLMTERRLLKNVPVIHWEQVKNNSRPRYFSPEEEQHILGLAGDMHYHAQWINDLLQDFIILLADTGMRPWSEAKEIKPSWVVRNSNGIRVIRIPCEVTKTDVEREIPLTGRLAEMLDRRMPDLAKGDVMFKKLDYKWHCVEFWDNLVRPVMGWGKKEVWYTFRHSFATRLCEYEVNLKVVQQLMGHSCITQTAKYAKVTDKATCAAMVSLEYGRLKALEEGQTSSHMQDKSEDRSGQTLPQTGLTNGLTH